MNYKYVKCGDVYLPDFALPEPVDKTLGKFAHLRLAFLQNHKSHFYTEMAGLSPALAVVWQ